MVKQDDYLKDYNFVIKGEYDKLPEIDFPMITILELENDENNTYYDNGVNNITNNAYQIRVSAGDSIDKNAREFSNYISNKADELLRGERYKLRRTSKPVLTPMVEDDSIMMAITRYDCCIDTDRHIIYRRR